MADEYSNTAVAVWPVKWVGVTDAHVTAFWFGPTENLDKAAVLEVMRSLNSNVYLMANTTSKALFGEDKSVPVIILEHSFLTSYELRLKKLLLGIGITSPSDHGKYKPHITVPSNIWNRSLPGKVMLYPVQLWWNDERINPHE